MHRTLSNSVSRSGLVKNVVILSVAGLLVSCRPGGSPDVTLFASKSLEDALRAIASEYRRETEETLNLRFSTAQDHLNSIRNAGRADLLIFDSPALMNEADAADLLVAGTETPIARTQLVFIGPAGQPPNMSSLSDLAAVGSIAIPAADQSGAGRRAKDFLDSLALPREVQDKLREVPSTRDVVSAVAAGEVEVGIALVSDGTTARGIQLLFEVAPEERGTILFHAAIPRTAPNPAEAREFLAYLQGERAASRLRMYLLTPLSEE